jgi:hypothetical protein
MGDSAGITMSLAVTAKDREQLRRAVMAALKRIERGDQFAFSESCRNWAYRAEVAVKGETDGE